jgi:hypothetical protein
MAMTMAMDLAMALVLAQFVQPAVVHEF